MLLPGATSPSPRGKDCPLDSNVGPPETLVLLRVAPASPPGERLQGDTGLRCREGSSQDSHVCARAHQGDRPGQREVGSQRHLRGLPEWHHGCRTLCRGPCVPAGPLMWDKGCAGPRVTSATCPAGRGLGVTPTSLRCWSQASGEGMRVWGSGQHLGPCPQQRVTSTRQG